MGRYAKGMQKTMWATRMVSTPRSNPIIEKKISVATAVTISGTIRGRLISPKTPPRSRNDPPRTMAIAAAVAMLVDVTAAPMAMISEFQAASLNFSDSGPVKTSTYQRSEKPPQRVIEAVSLNE